MASTKPALVHGPYHPPALGRGDRAACLYRDAEVIVTSWTDARISWPRCRVIGQRDGSGLLVDEELLRAIRGESSLALQHWFGVNEATVWRWRHAFGIPRYGTEGSRRLHQAASERGAAEVRGKNLPEAPVKRRIKIRAAKGFKMPRRWEQTGWKQWEIDLLGTAPDAELAARFGRSRSAVRAMRWRVGRQPPEQGN